MNRYYSSYSRNRGYKKNSYANSSGYLNESFYIKKADEIKTESAYVSDLKYEELAVDSQLKKNILNKGYLTPTPIQDKSINLILEGRDLIGVAKTGTGKTAAFLIPLIQKVLQNRNEKVLMVIPTRELATQINMELKALTANTSIFSVVCIGGTNIYSQVRSLTYAYNFLIATPGRLKDLLQRNAVKLNNVKYVVLDEVDRMFDMGFGNDVRYLLEEVPKPRQSLFFSATLSPNIEQLFARYLNNPIKIEIKDIINQNNIDQNIIRVTKDKSKIEVLHDLLIKQEFKKVLIFGKTKWGVKAMHRELEVRGFKVDSLHGNKTQYQRQKSLNLFKENKVNILVATDVAARGIDVTDISHVINYDLPATKEDYIHRIGRTGRANKKGVALTFVN